MSRIAQTFETLRAEGRSGLVCYFTAGDPDFESSLALLQQLGAAGADMIELGMPFSDPVADGPIIQTAHMRARDAGQTLARTLTLVSELRKTDTRTPLILMGYLNPVMQYGVERFMRDAARAGADALLLVDLPVEHAVRYRDAAREVGLHVLPMTAPTCDDERLDTVLRSATGFVYHVALTGTTGAAACTPELVGAAVTRLRRHTDLPVAVGFGIRDQDQVRAVAQHADLVVVGSRLVDMLHQQCMPMVLQTVREFAAALR